MMPKEFPPSRSASAGVQERHSPWCRRRPLARSGQVIAPEPKREVSPWYEPLPSTWIAPDASTRSFPLPGANMPYHGRGYHQPAHPGPGVCELSQHGLSALHAQFGETIAWITPVKDALGEVFLSCIDAEYYLHGWPIEAAVLLDGRQLVEDIRG